eukprot:12547242-Alexandrium_andersonii.AAC.1
MSRLAVLTALTAAPASFLASLSFSTQSAALKLAGYFFSRLPKSPSWAKPTMSFASVGNSANRDCVCGP